MSLYEEIKDRMKECMKNGNSQERDILRTLVGEIQSKSISSGKEATDDIVEKTLISFKENAVECIKYCHPDSPTEALNAIESSCEIEVYEKFLPKYESVDGIVELLSQNIDQLKSAKADGPATGMAMGILKKAGAKIQGKDVSEAVKKIRS